MEVDYSSINKGFSRQAGKFDEEDKSNVILQWMRGRVRAHVERHLEKGKKILELNAGTGLDAMYFAKQGFKVHATDLSEGMIKEIQDKIVLNNLRENLSVQQLSFTQMQQVENAPFDYVFSNFGGLNCIPDLSEVGKNLSPKLNYGSYLTLVIMPHVCPWEMILLMKGNWKRAFRRFKKHGTMANLEGEKFITYYFSPQQVKNAFGKNFKLLELEGLGTFCPPPHRKDFAAVNPSFFRSATRLDEILCHTFPFNRWCDHFIITLQYLP